MADISRFLVSATSSGSGKTTITVGLLRALKNRGLKSQPFKCGPDYIDIKYHETAANNKCINLDLFLSSSEHVNKLFGKYCSDKDIAIVEGVMGLFDGYDKMDGSSAQIAENLNIPIVLVINAKSMAYSAAAMLYGYKHFYRGIDIAGVIFNFVSSEGHYLYLKEACQGVGIESLGYIPSDINIEMPSRHLGLKIEKEDILDQYAEKIAQIVENHIDIEKLLQITQTSLPQPSTEVNKKKKDCLKITVAYDEAFNFVYHENIEYLKQLGTITYISPIRDQHLPETDFLYLPGGYPELYLDELSRNISMLREIRQYAENNGKIWAECGGMMYLSHSIYDEKGTEYPMVNIFDQKASMMNMKLNLGYRQFKYNDVIIKGHEFHYSNIDCSLESIAQQYNAKQQPVSTKLLRYKNTIAGYTHIYWAEMEDMIQLFRGEKKVDQI